MSLPHAILGILKFMPMTGYDLKKFCNDSIGFFWSSQMSQIYRELKTLESKDYVSAKEEISKKGPGKKVYKITKKGIVHLKEWLMNVPAKIDEDNHNAFLLRVMLLSDLGAEELYSQIQGRLKKYKKDLKELQSAEKKLHFYLQIAKKENQLPYWMITLNRGYHDLKSHIAWAEESLRELQKVLNKK